MYKIFRAEFVFLAANQDALKAAERINISRSNAMNFCATADSVNIAYNNLSSAATRYRSSTTTSNGNMFTSKEQNEATSIPEPKNQV